MSIVVQKNVPYMECYKCEYGKYKYIRNAEAACYGFEKNAECRLRCGLQLLTLCGMQSVITIVVIANYIYANTSTYTLNNNMLQFILILSFSTRL